MAIGPCITRDSTTMVKLCRTASWNVGSVRMIL